MNTLFACTHVPGTRRSDVAGLRFRFFFSFCGFRLLFSLNRDRAHHRPEAMAAVNDIRLLREAMQQVSEMETELARLGDKVSGRSIELKSTLKKRLSAPTMVEVRFGEAWLCGTVRYDKW